MSALRPGGGIQMRWRVCKAHQKACRPAQTRLVCSRPTRASAPEVAIACALSSVEEHFLHTEGVAGSSPAARTIFERGGVGQCHRQPTTQEPRKLSGLG